MGHHRIAAGACGRGAGARQKQGLAGSNLAPLGDVINGLDLLTVGSEANAQDVAHTGNGLALLHGVRNQPVSGVDAGGGAGGAAARATGAAGDNGAAGGAAAADVGLGDLDSILIGGRQCDNLAHAQFSVLCLADVVQLIDGSLAAVPVQAQLVADLQKRVARFERILLGCVLLVCIGTDRHAPKQRGDHEHRQKHADESFLHDCVPPNLPFPGKNNCFLAENNFQRFSISLRFGYNITTSVNKLQYLIEEKFQIISNCYKRLCNLLSETIAHQGFQDLRQILNIF